MHKTPQSPKHLSLHEKKTHFYKHKKEALSFLYAYKKWSIWKINASLPLSPVFLFTAQTMKNHKGGILLFCMLIKIRLSERFPDSIIVILGNRNQCELLTLGCNP